MAMEIQHDMQAQKGVFYIQGADKRSAEMSYVWAGTTKIIIDHTEVGEVLKGKGAGKLLLAAVVAFARTKNIKILPVCPFAKAIMEKTTEYSDVLF